MATLVAGQAQGNGTDVKNDYNAIKGLVHTIVAAHGGNGVDGTNDYINAGPGQVTVTGTSAVFKLRDSTSTVDLNQLSVEPGNPAINVLFPQGLNTTYNPDPSQNGLYTSANVDFDSTNPTSEIRFTLHFAPPTFATNDMLFQLQVTQATNDTPNVDTFTAMWLSKYGQWAIVRNAGQDQLEAVPLPSTASAGLVILAGLGTGYSVLRRRSALAA
jgi:hypothetical protein